MIIVRRRIAVVMIMVMVIMAMMINQLHKPKGGQLKLNEQNILKKMGYNGWNRPNNWDE